ncbi:MAG: 1-acyl-sn-glycerol-3-phosphate acyltransferase [Clostridiales Family XIII bacterium]|nr:1-acyl-sn-glycerol-3-phosphate acyltransferase [Clostridiales Family XIII bacterium]
MNVFNMIRLGAFILSTLPPIRKHKHEMDSARADGDHAREQEWIRLAENFWGPKVFDHYGVTVDMSGESPESLPDGGVLFVSNHEGFGDIPLFMVAIKTKQFGFVAKGELYKIPVFNKWIARIRSLMLERDDPRYALKVFGEGEEWLRQGFSLVIFPEGHRAKGKGMQPFQKGSLRMALRAHVPIVPISTKGSWECFENAGYPHPGVIRFHIHPVIETTNITKSEEGALSDRIEKMIRDKLTEWEQAEGKEA